MENKDNSKEEKQDEISKKDINDESKKEEIPINDIKNESKKEEITINDMKNESKKDETNKSLSKIEIKRPIISEVEYQNMIKKRNIMIKNARFRPIKLLFGKQKNPLNFNNTITTTSPNINNTNIQINNYTTYLTTVDSIKEEQYQKDGKTLMIENPLYYPKNQLNYKNKNDHLNKIMIIYIKKLNEIEDIYNFTNEYLSFIINLFQSICRPYISALLNLFDNSIKPNLKYFQNLFPILKEFSTQLKLIENKNIIDMNNNPDADLINSIKTLNNKSSENYNEVSNNIKNIILNNPLYIQIDNVDAEFNETFNKMKIFLNKLIKRRNKYNSKYQNIILPIFSEIKKSLNNPTVFYEFISNSNDFIFIEELIISMTNKIYTKISQFLINMDILFKSSHKKFCDYLELLNNLIKSFAKDNKNTFNIESLLPNKLIISLNSILNSNNIRKKIEKRFQFNNVIVNFIENKLVNDINHSLLNYRELLLQYNYIKSEEIDDIINFNLIKYKSSDNFIQFLMRLIPDKFLMKFEELIELQMNIKRNNTNIFNGQKNSLLIITFQGHILLFDQDKLIEKKKKKKEDNQNSNKKMSRKEIINSIIIEEEKKNDEIKIKEKSDNNELYEAIINNKLTHGYIRSKFGMSKVVITPGKFLMYLYEKNMNFKQYKIVLIDLLNENNMNNLINVISKNKII